MIPCENLQEQLVEYVDNQLSLAERFRIETHVRQCEGCRMVVAAMNETKRALLRVPAAIYPPVDWEMRFQASLRPPLNKAARFSVQQRVLFGVLTALVVVWLAIWSWNHFLGSSPALPSTFIMADYERTRLGTTSPSLNIASLLQSQLGTQSGESLVLPTIPMKLGNYPLNSASIWQMQRVRVPRLVYQTPQGPLNFYLLPGEWKIDDLKPVGGSRVSMYSFCCTSVNLVTWQRGDYTSVLVSQDLPEQELINLAQCLVRTCY